MSWIETNKGTLVNLDHVESIHVVPMNSKWEVRTYSRVGHGPIAEFDSEAKANAYRDAVKIHIARAYRMGTFKKLTEGIV